MCQFATYRPSSTFVILCSPSLTLNIFTPSRFWKIIPPPPPWSRLSVKQICINRRSLLIIFITFFMDENLADWMKIRRSETFEGLLNLVALGGPLDPTSMYKASSKQVHLQNMNSLLPPPPSPRWRSLDTWLICGNRKGGVKGELGGTFLSPPIKKCKPSV